MSTCQANPQPLEALRKASATRTARAEVLRRLGARELSPAVLINEPPECLESMLVFDFLRACPGIDVGRLKQINRWAMREDVNLALALGELSRLRRAWVAGVAVSPCRRVVVTGSAIPSRPQG